MTATTLDLLRHGEAEGGRRYRGQLDDPLSERGWQQMWAAVEVPGTWEAIVSSPLSRCHAFANALAERLAVPLAADSRLSEVRFGSWEGRSGAELKQDDPRILARFYVDPVTQRPPDAEPLADFYHRVSDAFQELVEQHRGHHILVVTHAGVIRAMVAHVLRAPLESLYRISVANASIARIRIDGERPPTLFFLGRQSL